jgi:FkbM family methyltransferase
LEHQAMLRALRPDLVVDVGANRGQFSLDVRRATPDARVLAFEPLRSEAGVYRSIFGSTAHYALHEVALGTEAGSADFHLSAARDSSSLLAICQRQSELFPGTEEVGTEQVAVQTLDYYVDDIDSRSRSLLKLDVQGGELDVLRGGVKALGRFRWVYLEMSFVELYEGQPLADDVIEFLQAHGFGLAGVGRPSIREGLPVQVDALFVGSELRARDRTCRGHAKQEQE